MSEKQVIKYVKDRNIAEYNTKDGLGNKYFEALGSTNRSSALTERPSARESGDDSLSGASDRHLHRVGAHDLALRVTNLKRRLIGVRLVGAVVRR